MCPACGGDLEFRSSARSPTKYARCSNCGTFINFSKRATQNLGTDRDATPAVLKETPEPTQVPPQEGPPAKSLYERWRDGEL